MFNSQFQRILLIGAAVAIFLLGDYLYITGTKRQTKVFRFVEGYASENGDLARCIHGADAFIYVLSVRSRWGAKGRLQPGGKEAIKMVI